MALPATHVRYALELMPPSVEPQKCTYLAGTLYPDSRMLYPYRIRDQDYAKTEVVQCRQQWGATPNGWVISPAGDGSSGYKSPGSRHKCTRWTERQCPTGRVLNS